MRHTKYVFIIAFVFLAGVTSASEQKCAVNLQLRWFHQFQFAGYYAAKELGYYDEAGMDVNIIEGGLDTDVMKEVVSGKAEYGVQTPSIVVDRSEGNPVVVLAAIFQHSPVALIVNS
ncbi:MAG: ABC transporter substrate-binding protein, partial [Candidatus Delongbacteria bacterium]